MYRTTIQNECLRTGQVSWFHESIPLECLRETVKKAFVAWKYKSRHNWEVVCVCVRPSIHAVHFQTTDCIPVKPASGSSRANLTTLHARTTDCIPVKPASGSSRANLTTLHARTTDCIPVKPASGSSRANLTMLHARPVQIAIKRAARLHVRN
jgi:hypothetical protein